MNRKAKLEKALAIQKLNPSRLSRQFNQGKEAENSRLAPLHEALLAVVEALEFYADESYSLREGYVIAAKDGLCDYASGEAATEALSKIDKVLGDGK